MAIRAQTSSKLYMKNNYGVLLDKAATGNPVVKDSLACAVQRCGALPNVIILFCIILACSSIVVDGAQDYSLNNLVNLQGFVMSSGGRACSAAGDINGDGVGDVIIGDYTVNGLSGIVYVVFGKKVGMISNMNLPTFVTGPTTGFRISTAAVEDHTGISVSRAGDVNGDGIDDVIIGAFAADPSGARPSAGISYVVFGRKVTSAGNAFVDFSLPTTAMAASVGFRILGAATSDFSGNSVNAAGDVNGDGIDDVIVGAYHGDPPGQGTDSNGGIACVVFGKNLTGSSVPFGDVDLASITTGSSRGFRILAAEAGDNLGRSVSRAGDINGDGISDVIIGADEADPAGLSANSKAGITYVIFGRSLTVQNFLPFADIALTTSTMSTSIGFRLLGVAPDDYSGNSVSAAGDVNGDGIDDIIVGAHHQDPSAANSDAGVTYVIFGRNVAGGAAPFTDILLSTIATTPAQGFRILGIAVNDHSGSSVSAAGDVNGDGVDDVIVGAPYADPPTGISAGISYVIYGRKSVNGAIVFNDIDLATVVTGSPVGFRVLGASGGHLSGFSVSGGSDVSTEEIFVRE